MANVHLLTTLLALFTLTASGSSLLREPGAIYFEDVLPKSVRVTVQHDTSIYYDAELTRYLGTLRKGQAVELQAILKHAYRVRGKAQQGQVAGWIDPGEVTALDPDFLKTIKQAAARKAEVDALIAANEVAIHMTSAEVIASLGKPQKKNARLDEKGQSEVWEYIRYERVPQQTSGYDRYGRLVTDVVYVKVPAGRLSVIFDNGLVNAIEQSEGTLREGRAKIIATPFLIE